MTIPIPRIIHPEARMSPAVAELAETEACARSLVDREAQRVGSRAAARERVARAVGVSPGTIENLDRGRLRKSPGGWLRDALKARAIRALEAQLAGLRHERQILVQTGADPRRGDLAEVEADIAKVLAALGRSE